MGCLSESYKINKLMKEERLYTHPLFELARSSAREGSDNLGSTSRLNHSERDDEEVARLPSQVQFTELRPFSGSGHALGDAGDHSYDTSTSNNTEFQQLAAAAAAPQPQ